MARYLRVRDETLEDATGQLMGVIHAGRVDRLGRLSQPPEDSPLRQRRATATRMSLEMAKLAQGFDTQDHCTSITTWTSPWGLINSLAAATMARGSISSRCMQCDVHVPPPRASAIDIYRPNAAGLGYVDHSQMAGYLIGDAR